MNDKDILDEDITLMGGADIDPELAQEYRHAAQERTRLENREPEVKNGVEVLFMGAQWTVTRVQDIVNNGPHEIAQETLEPEVDEPFIVEEKKPEGT